MPISIAGWGVRESSMVVAFGYAGLAQSDGLTLSILFGLLELRGRRHRRRGVDRKRSEKRLPFAALNGTRAR